eukprot:TRINITY_DN14639_c0_g1_i1.p2 TRINITY_DN14639_c0_g1~~TRINITY_DN14639_c0_g1_i1.p2  ORF type:complete len:124 (+),score=13.28 TRINITY_DN14639_c0_g1_i1:641-1012(+)
MVQSHNMNYRSPRDVFALQRAAVHLFNDQLPRYLHILCTIPQQRSGGVVHLRGLSRYECWNTDFDTEADWAQLCGALRAVVRFDPCPYPDDVVSAADSAAAAEGSLWERFDRARTIVAAAGLR